ncbi:class I SAM-dependent methyltransferase [Acetobacteraceae bacterium H6797]|nr:class I SAM-dependent methyltransferase [Acetobacteraceae bacterium H6797]
MTEVFDGDWLDQREGFDAQARSPELALMLADALPARPRLLDLGAGTGSLARWMGPLIGRSQAWTLVDADRLLIERAFVTISDRANAVGWNTTWPGKRTLLVHSPRGTWRIEGLQADLRAIPGSLPLHNIDAVVCTALCDLVSAAWVEKIAAACAARRLPFYAALNVDGRERFIPPHPLDGLVMGGFTRDQGRDKGFGGRALGRQATAALTAAFKAQGYEVHHAASPWVAGPGHSEFAATLAWGHAEAAMNALPRESARIEAWAETRERQAVNGKLQARIGHTDLLALPPK